MRYNAHPVSGEKLGIIAGFYKLVFYSIPVLDNYIAGGNSVIKVVAANAERIGIAGYRYRRQRFSIAIPLADDHALEMLIAERASVAEMEEQAKAYDRQNKYAEGNRC